MADNNEEILLKLKIQTDKSNAALKKTDVAIKKTIQSFKQLKKGSIEYQEAQAKLIGLQANYAKQTLDYNKALQAQIGAGDKGLKGVSKASGGATAATLELGRAISDAPYGIRGVANNLSQFASQFSFMANKVDDATGKVVGFNGAIKGLGKAIKANAILLLIQLVIAAFDKYSGGAKKAKTETDSLSKSFGIQTTKLMVLKSALDDSNVSLEDKTELVKKANKEFKDLNIELDENGNLTDASRLAIDKHSIALVKNAKAKSIATLITNEMNNQAKLEAEESGDQLSYLETLYSAISAKIIGTSKAISNAQELDGKKRDKEIEKSETRVKKFLKMLKDNGADLAKSLLNDDVESGGKSAKISPFKTKEALELDVENNLSAQQKLQKQTELINLKTEEKLYLNSVQSEEDKLAFKELFAHKRLDLDEKYEEIAIKAKEDAEIASVNKKEARRIKELEDDLTKYKKNLEDKGVADTAAGKESIAKATKEVEEKVALTKKEAGVTVKEIEDKYAALIPFYKKLNKARRDAIGIGEEGVDENTDLQNIQTFVDNYKILMSGLTEFLDGEFERQLTAEQNKTNVLNKELNDRLINENLSAEQRKNIQNQIAQNDEDLRVKQEAIKKKQFKQQKAFNIAMAVISTYSAAAKVLDDTKGGSFARIAGMIAVIGSGLAQVAAISRQKYQSTSANTPIRTSTGGSGASQRTDPSFNIVGRSNENLLINAIQAQFDKPLKAYVVSRDVTTQQQLDGMIVGQAGT